MRRAALAALFAALPAYALGAEATPLLEDGNLDCLIEPLMVVQVGSRADGVLEEVLVDRGDTVKHGQLLAGLDSLPERAALELARQRAREDVAVRSSQVKYEFGQRRAALFSDTYLAEAATDLERDEASTAARLARLGVDEARANRLIASLEVARVEALLQQRRITSPLNGVVVERLMNPGERVTDSPILTLAQIDPLKVEVIVPVAMLGSMKIGSRAVILPEAPVSGEYAAIVTVVDRVVDARSGTFGVRLELPNPDHALPGGLRCQVRFLDEPALPATAETAPAAQPAPVLPELVPAPPQPAPPSTPPLHSAQAEEVSAPEQPATAAATPDVSADAVSLADAAARRAMALQPERTAATTLGNLLLPTAAASSLDQPERTEDAGPDTNARVVASSTAVAVAAPPSSIVTASDAAGSVDPVSAGTQPAPSKAEPIGETASAEVAGIATASPAVPATTAPAFDAEAEQAILAALPPLPVLLALAPEAPVPAAPIAAAPTTENLSASTPPKAATRSGLTQPAALAVVPATMNAVSVSATTEPAMPQQNETKVGTQVALAAVSPDSTPSRVDPPRDVVSRCQAIGPIHDANTAGSVAERARSAGWSTRQKTREDRSTRKRVLTVALLDGDIAATGAALQAKGFRDLSYLDSGPFVGNWSAGVFSNMEFAEDRRSALAAAGFESRLHPFGRAQKQHWVEIDGAALDSDDLAGLGSPASASLDACN